MSGVNGSDPLNVELLMLREFYGVWCELHSIPRTKDNERRMQVAAQRLVDCGRTVARFKKGEPILEAETVQ